MNPWDVFTWFCAVALAVSGIVIFGFFLRDVRGILGRDLQHLDDEEGADDTAPNTWD